MELNILKMNKEYLKDTDVTWIKEVIDWACPKCLGSTLFNLKNNYHYCEKCAHLIDIVPKHAKKD